MKYRYASANRTEMPVYRRTFSVACALSLLLIPLPASADFDTSIGQAGVSEERKYHQEQEERAKTTVQKLDSKTVTHHPYYEGTDQETINKNNLYDKDVILNPETYEECLDYIEIGKCLSILPGPNGPTVQITPFVRYFGPWQKGEEVPEAFRTGYIEKEVIKEEKKKVIETDLKYYDEDGFAKNMIEEELKYVQDVAYPYLNNRIGTNIQPKEVPTANPAIIKKTGDIVKKLNSTLGEASMAGDGFVFNDYHLFPAISSMYSPGDPPNHPEPGPGAEMLPPTENPFYGWCHVPKQPVPFLGESSGNLPFSRISSQTRAKFPEVIELQIDPMTCIGFNISKGLTPPQLAGLPQSASQNVCQGVNQGAWLPVTHRVHTTYQTTAAAIGLTRSRLAYRLQPGTFYDISPKDDKVQWIQNDRMDGASSVVGKTPTGAIGKKCSKLAKFVLEYERGNLKIGPLVEGDNGPGRDHWNVLAHWRKIRCCPKGGVPVFVTDPTEEPSLILE